MNWIKKILGTTPKLTEDQLWEKRVMDRKITWREHEEKEKVKHKLDDSGFEWADAHGYPNNAFVPKVVYPFHENGLSIIVLRYSSLLSWHVIMKDDSREGYCDIAGINLPSRPDEVTKASMDELWEELGKYKYRYTKTYSYWPSTYVTIIIENE